MVCHINNKQLTTSLYRRLTLNSTLFIMKPFTSHTSVEPKLTMKCLWICYDLDHATENSFRNNKHNKPQKHDEQFENRRNITLDDSANEKPLSSHSLENCVNEPDITKLILNYAFLGNYCTAFHPDFLLSSNFQSAMLLSNRTALHMV